MTSSAAPKSTPEQLLAQALELPKEQRLRLADRLLDSVEDDDNNLELDPELRDELIRRMRTIEDGSAVLLDGEEVMRELRAKYER